MAESKNPGKGFSHPQGIEKTQTAEELERTEMSWETERTEESEETESTEDTRERTESTIGDRGYIATPSGGSALNISLHPSWNDKDAIFDFARRVRSNDWDADEQQQERYFDAWLKDGAPSSVKGLNHDISSEVFLNAWECVKTPIGAKADFDRAWQTWKSAPLPACAKAFDRPTQSLLRLYWALQRVAGPDGPFFVPCRRVAMALSWGDHAPVVILNRKLCRRKILMQTHKGKHGLVSKSSSAFRFIDFNQ